MVRSPDDGTTSGVGGRHGSPWRAAGATLVALSAVTGMFMMRAAVEAGSVPPPPQPVAEAAGPGGGEVVAPLPAPPRRADGTTPPRRTDGTTDGTTDRARAATDGTTNGRPAEPGTVAGAEAGLPRSVPTEIKIPKIGVDARIRQLGVNPDGTIQVPPLKQAQDAGWYRLGPSPGEIGNAVVVGHVDSRYIGAAVFYRLGSLRPGDVITLTRQDRTTVRFRVDGVRSFPKTQFPTDLVYGPNDRAGLRVVTCGGKFDETRKTYPDNIVVSATLVAPTIAPVPARPGPTANPPGTPTPPGPKAPVGTRKVTTRPAPGQFAADVRTRVRI